jgi:serine/threonine protein kinase
MSSRLGEVLAGKYVLQDVLGVGGMATVYRADQPDLGRTVAIKMLYPQFAAFSDFVDRFHTEAIAMCRLSHPNIVSVLDYGHTDDGAAFLVLEYVPGKTIGQLVRDAGALSFDRIAIVMTQLLDAIGEAHAAGVIHADIKSDNVLVEATRTGDRVRVVDFGLARLSRNDRGDAMVSGTPEYMAPEVICGEPITPSVDLYSAGIILYELLVGATPFAGGSVEEVMARQVNDVVIPPSLRRPDRGIPPVLDRVVARALAKRPEKRFADAAAFTAALIEALAAADDDPRQCTACERPAPIAAAFCPHCGAARPRPLESRDTPTRNQRRRVARGSDARNHPSREHRLRNAIGRAIRDGDVGAIVDAYIGLARILVGSARLTDAIQELEEALAVLDGGDPGVVPEASRVLAELAVLCDAQGDSTRARRARAALEHHRTLPNTVS